MPNDVYFWNSLTAMALTATSVILLAWLYAKIVDRWRRK